jgi:hypothetical protein
VDSRVSIIKKIKNTHYIYRVFILYPVLYLGYTVPKPIADSHLGVPTTTAAKYRVFILYPLPITHLGIPINTAELVELYLHRHHYII